MTESGVGMCQPLAVGYYSNQERQRKGGVVLRPLLPLHTSCFCLHAVLLRSIKSCVQEAYTQDSVLWLLSSTLFFKKNL